MIPVHRPGGAIPGPHRRRSSLGLIASGVAAAFLVVTILVIFAVRGSRQAAAPDPNADPILVGALGGETLSNCIALAQDGDPECFRRLVFASSSTNLSPDQRQAVTKNLLGTLGLDAVPHLVAHQVEYPQGPVPHLLQQLAQPPSAPAISQWSVFRMELDSWSRNPAYWPTRRISGIDPASAIVDSLHDAFTRPNQGKPSPFEQQEYRNAIARLTPLLVHADPVVQLAAAALMDRYGGLVSRDGTEVKPLLTSQLPAVREFAIRALGKDGKLQLARKHALLIQALEDPENRVRGAAALMLGRQLEGRVKSDSTKVSPDLFHEHGGMRLLDDLGVVVKTGLKYDRPAAAGLLGLLGPHARPAVPTLHQALQHPDVRLRVAAAVALARVAPEDETAMPQVLAWLDLPPTQRIQHAQGYFSEVNHRSTVGDAIACLGFRGQHAARHVSKLVHLLDTTGEHNWQLDLCRALARIGPDARTALPSLRRLAANCTDYSLRGVVRETMQKIDQATEK